MADKSQERGEAWNAIEQETRVLDIIVPDRSQLGAQNKSLKAQQFWTLLHSLVTGRSKVMQVKDGQSDTTRFGFGQCPEIHHANKLACFLLTTLSGQYSESDIVAHLKSPSSAS